MGWTPEFAIRAAEGDLTVGVIGLGYVGLPTAIGFHELESEMRRISESFRELA